MRVRLMSRAVQGPKARTEGMPPSSLMIDGEGKRRGRGI